MPRRLPVDHRAPSRRATAAGLAAALVLLAVAPTATRAAGRAGPDWHRLDLLLDRGMLVSRYLFHDRQPADPWADYLTTLNDGAAPNADDLVAFAALDPVVRAERRRQAADLRRRAILAVEERATRLRDALQAGAYNQVGDLMDPTPGFGEAVTAALQRLDRAAVLDPTSVETWYHLTFFSDLAGDRQRTARSAAGFQAAWQALPAAQRDDLRPLRHQFVLDEAWRLREAGRFQACLDWLDAEAGALPAAADPPAVAPRAEAALVRGLVHAERGEWALARGQLPGLPELRLPSRTAAPLRTYVHVRNQRTVHAQRFRGGNLEPIHNTPPEWRNDPPDNLSREHRSSDVLRRWIHGWVELRRGHEAQTVMRAMGRPMTELEFPPRLAWRWWQDQGLIYEELGEVELARACWARAAVSRPLFIYHPFGQGRGASRVHGLSGTGEPYFLAYGTFFVAGSLWSYAANAALASEAENHPLAQATLRAQALAGLDACIRRGLAPHRARALRGRLHFLAEDYAAAEADLAAAWEALDAGQAAPSDLALMIGLCQFNQQQWTAARPWLQAFVTRDPDAHVGWQALALTLAFLEQTGPAATAMDRAVALAPQNATYHFNRGLLRYRSGQRDQARHDFERAQQLWPENPQIARMIAVCREPVTYDLQLSTEPIGMRLPEHQRAELAGVLWGGDGPRAGGAGDLAELMALDGPARDEMLTRLERRFAADPSPENRRRLAQACLMADQPERTAAVLAPLWPRRLEAQERRLLLLADRRTGDLARAAELAAGLKWPGQGADAELMVLAATILMDHDRRDLARPLVERALELQPGRAALQDLHRRLQSDR